MFCKYRNLSRKRYVMGLQLVSRSSYYGTLIRSRKWLIDPCRFITLSDLERWGVRGPIIWQMLITLIGFDLERSNCA